MNPILDYLTVSVPKGAGLDLRDALTDVCLSLPGSQTDPLGVRVGKWALLRFQDRPSVTVASISGMMCMALRASSLLDDYLGAVASTGPHRVTQMHAAKDVLADCPTELARIYAQTRVHGVALTRKRIPGRSVKWIKSSTDDGRDTGSLMIGHRARHETTGCIYDRQQDALDKGKPDPGPLLRYELRTGVEGLTLRDAANPAPVFHHFMRAFFVRPDDVPEWVAHGEGFHLDRTMRDLPDQLRRQVENSTDLQRMFRLADQLPGEGLDVLVRMIRAQHRTHLQTLTFAAGSTARPATADNSETH